jgi:hypothetical protein
MERDVKGARIRLFEKLYSQEQRNEWKVVVVRCLLRHEALDAPVAGFTLGGKARYLTAWM